MALTGEQYQLPLISFAVPAAHACAATLPAKDKIDTVPAAATRPRMLVLKNICIRLLCNGKKKECVSKVFTQDVMCVELITLLVSRQRGK